LLAFGVTLLGSFSTGLGGQLVTAGLPDIQGGLGVSADEASWISTVYPMAQILMVPLAAPLSLSLGIRRFLIILTGLFLFSCVLAATARTLEGEIVLRLLQGISAGGYGTAAFAMTFRTFGGRDLLPGIVGLAFATTFPTAIGLSCAAWLTEGLGWPALYGFDGSLAVLVLIGVYRYMDPECFRPTPLEKLDWTGFLLLAPGLALLFLVLSQGDRRFWTEAPWLGTALFGCIALLGGFVFVERSRTNPLVNLAMLWHPNFGVACLLNFLFRLVLLSPTVLVPRFLTELQGYRNEQMLAVFAPAACVQLLTYPAIALLVRRLDPRWLIAGGFALLASGLILDAAHTSLSSADQFQLSQLLTGLSPPLVIIPVLLLGVRGVRPEDGASAGVLWNSVLTLGSTGGSGVVAYLIRMRVYQHSDHLNDFLSTGWAPTADRLDALSGSLGSRIVDDSGAQVAATSAISASVHRQAVTLALGDVFLLLAVVAAVGAVSAGLFSGPPGPKEAR
jgi:DHA2 family multidrug resistance protein